MDTIEGITDSATLETSRLPEDAALPVLTGVVAFNRLLEELVVWEEAEALSEDAAVEALLKDNPFGASFSKGPVIHFGAFGSNGFHRFTFIF